MITARLVILARLINTHAARRTGRYARTGACETGRDGRVGVRRCLAYVVNNVRVRGKPSGAAALLVAAVRGELHRWLALSAAVGIDAVRGRDTPTVQHGQRPDWPAGHAHLSAVR